MAPALRWIVGIVLALVAFGLWTTFKPGDAPAPPVKGGSPGKAVASDAKAPDAATRPSESTATTGAAAPAGAPATAPVAAGPTSADAAGKTADGDRKAAEGAPTAAKPAETTPVAAALGPVAPLGAVAAPRSARPLAATVLFDFDRSALRPGEAGKLDELAGKLERGAIDRVEVAGYADRIGEEPYNARLSDRRAKSVVDYLVGKGIDRARVRAEAKGESEPLADTACANLGPENAGNRKLVDCLERDRRAEVRIVAK